MDQSIYKTKLEKNIFLNNEKNANGSIYILNTKTTTIKIIDN
jgi:hypothetical protein